MEFIFPTGRCCYGGLCFLPTYIPSLRENNRSLRDLCDRVFSPGVHDAGLNADVAFSHSDVALSGVQDAGLNSPYEKTLGKPVSSLLQAADAPSVVNTNRYTCVYRQFGKQTIKLQITPD